MITKYITKFSSNYSFHLSHERTDMFCSGFIKGNVVTTDHQGHVRVKPPMVNLQRPLLHSHSAYLPAHTTTTIPMLTVRPECHSYVRVMWWQ